MNKIFRLAILLLLVGTASAAVYHVLNNPEARLYFFVDTPEDTPMVQHLIRMPSGHWTGSLGIGEVNSTDTLCVDVMHVNKGEEDYYAQPYVLVFCDQGINIESYRGGDGGTVNVSIEDFTHISYIFHDRTPIECNLSNTEILSGNEIKITPIIGEVCFPVDYDVFSKILIDFHEYAHGNYTVTVNAEEL